MARELGQTSSAFPPRSSPESSLKLRRMRTVNAPANGVGAGYAAVDQVPAPVAATSGGRGPREERRLQEGGLRRLFPGQRLAQIPKHIRSGFEEETEELGGPAA